MDRGGAPSIAPLSQAQLELRRRASGLADRMPSLTSSLESAVDAGQLIVVTDIDGRVLWQVGGRGVRRMADRLGFVGGSAWTEANVGTNAIGTALVLGEPVQIRGPEHFVESHAIWLPTLGAATAEALPGGWLLRLGEHESGRVALEIDLTGSPRLTVRSEDGGWGGDLSPRHAELLVALVRSGPAGRTAADLADDLFADRSGW